MIVDTHAHIFPPLSTAPGFTDAAEHRATLQLYIAGHPQPIRRLSDHSLAPQAELRDFGGNGLEPLPDVNFRVGRFGRFEWTIDGVDYYRQFLPPGLQETESPVDFLLQSMAYAGVDCAVLQNARLYGRLEEQFAEAIRDHPDKFVGLAGADEPNAHTSAEIERLRRAIRDLGLKGVYYANRGFYRDGFRHRFDDARFEPYWAEIEALDAVIFWEIAGVPLPTMERYLREIDRLDRWLDRHPAARCVLTHGIPPEFLHGEMEDPIARLLRHEGLLIEVLYPIGVGGMWRYPYHELTPALRELYGRVGGRRLIWGSDMPNVERYCTYRQSLDYLDQAGDFIPSSDRERILGGNVAALFDLR